MKQATYTDAVLIARMLRLSTEFVWSVIRGMMFTQHFELRIAVLNSPPANATFARPHSSFRSAAG